MIEDSSTTRKIVALPALGKVSINFYCSSENVISLYEKTNEFERQKQIRHLGLISNVFEGASHTRYEYLMLQAALSDLLDNIHKGSATASQGNLTIDRKKYLGNGLLKSWFLLSNFGHAINTIGDEKSLLLFALKQPGFKSHLLQPIRDEQLYMWADESINNFNYVAFHHIISIRRLYKELPRQIEKREFLIKLYKLLLIDHDTLKIRINKNKLEQLRRLFTTVRSLSIATIDGHYSHSPISCDLISTLLSVDSVENIYKNLFLLESINPLLSTLHETIYLDRNVLAVQREYEIKALEYLQKRPKTAASYESSIARAISCGLIDFNERTLYPFSRLPISKEIQTSRSFYDEFSDILTARKNCVGVEASLDENPKFLNLCPKSWNELRYMV